MECRKKVIPPERKMRPIIVKTSPTPMMGRSAGKRLIPPMAPRRNPMDMVERVLASRISGARV
jgi:hypothetical protein